MSPEVKEKTILLLILGVMLVGFFVWSALTKPNVDTRQAMDQKQYDDCVISVSKNKNPAEKQSISTTCINLKKLYKETYGVEP